MSVLDGVRAFGVMLGGPLVLDACVAASLIGVARAVRQRRRPHPIAVAGTVVVAGYVVAVRPWIRRWGATEEEMEKPLPGDELVPDAGIATTRAVTIEAPVEEVWPWLAQIGQDRAGFYSYEWLENLAGCRLRNAERIHPEWQVRQVGDLVLLHPATGVRLARFEPNRVLALDGWGAFVLERIGGDRTRLIVRGRGKRGFGSVAYGLLLEVPHFVMERKMLLGIRERAERRVR